MLQNCHLLLDFMLELEVTVAGYSDPDAKIDENFRLWLTTNTPGPGSSFPLGLLQNSLKIVMQPPDGLKLNMKSLLSKIDDEKLEECSHYAFRSLVYVISFFHAII